MAELKEHRKVRDFEAQVRRLDGTTLWISITAEIFPEKGYWEGTIKDITINKVLSKTEIKILNHIMQGKSNKEIAYILDRSVRTIEDHRSHIMQKLGTGNLVDLTQKVLNSASHPIKE